MENIEYNSIVKYINQDIIGQAIYSNSTITNNFFGGAKPEYVKEAKDAKDKNKYILKKVGRAFGLSEETMAGLNIDKKSENISFVLTGLSFLAGVLNMQGEYNIQNIVSCVGLIVLGLIINNETISKDYSFKSIISNLGNYTKSITYFQQTLSSFNNMIEIIDIKGLKTIVGLKGGANIIRAVTEPLVQFATFIFWFINEMMSRPIIASMINSAKKFINSNGTTELVEEAGFIDELTAAFYVALEKTRTGKNPDNEILGSFKFNEKKGEIEYLGKTEFKKITTLISSSPKKIQMETLPNRKITYLINSVEISGKSMIEGKPVDLALVIAYIQAKGKAVVPRVINSNYSFSLESDGSVKLFENGNEISTVTRAEKEVNPTYIQEVCQSLFGVKTGLGDKTCSSYFYSAVGKSVEGILKTFGGVSHDIHSQILSANFGVLYDLLKRLGWNTRINLRREYELITVEEWESTEGKRFIEYLKTNPQVRNLLVRIVERLNSNPEFLNLRYNYEYSQKQPKKGHHMSKTITLSKLVTLGETLALSGLKTNIGHIGGGNKKQTHPLELKYSEMIGMLKSYNQKLNSKTDEIIRQKIKKIIELETEIEKINTNILSYVRMLKSNKELIVNGKILSLEEIESMLSSQEEMTKTHNKRILNLSTAFGKIQLLIETVPLIEKKQSNPIYHLI